MDVDLVVMPLERLEAELCTWSANMTAAEFRWFEMLAEFDRREGWQQWGASSCVAWMCWQLGLDSRTAREKLRVARALTCLPLVCEQMRLGRLPYSKVRAITRIAEPANEEGLVSIALAGTTHQVERVVAAYRRALPPGDEASDAVQWARRGVHVQRNADRTITITATLPAPLGVEVVAAIDAFTQPPGPTEEGERPGLAERRADGLVAMAGVATALPGESGGSSGSRSPYLVHLHTGDERQEIHAEGQAADVVVGVSDATADRICCDADEETVGHDGEGTVTRVSARGSVVRGRLRRLVEQRDRTCQVPGCDRHARHHVHHLHHRSHGGSNDLANLTLVCAYHHHRLHEGGWSAHRRADGSVEFILPDGTVLPGAPVVVNGSAEAVGVAARDADDGRCHWVGDRLDLDWTLTTLFSQTPWHDPWRSAWLAAHHHPATVPAEPG